MISLPPILALGFLSPWLMAAGGAATSIPIVIHLLNKRKFRIVVWAAMEWLLAAQRRNARRLKFQRWLLLLIRCLAILIIAAGIAEMILQNSAIGSLLGEQHAVLIVWDDSYSMGYQQDGAAGARAAGAAGGTAFEKSKRLITDYISNLKSGDTVMVIRASTGAAADSAGGKPTPDHQSVKDQVSAAKLTDASTDLPSAFDYARKILTEIQQTTRSRELLVITDFSNSSIHDPRRGAGVDNAIEGIAGDKLKKAALGAIAHATDFHLVDVGTDSQTNTAITALTSRRPVVVAGVPTDLQVEIFNGSDPQMDVPVSLLVDGIPAGTVKIPKLEAGSFQTAAVSVTIATPGRHLVEARLAGDLLAVDDTRRLMLNVRKEIPVLLVDGSPGDGGRTSYGSTFYLYAAYAIPAAGKPASMFTPKVVTELELPTTPLANYDIVVLSDTSDPGPAMRESLQKFVANGGLLILFPGARTNTQRMNEAFGENGANLLPATLGQTMKPVGADQLAEGKTFDAEGFLKNPVLQTFAADYKAGNEVGLLTVQTTQYFKLGVPADGSSETILRYSDKLAVTTPAAGTTATLGDAAVVMRRGVGADAAKGTPGGTVVLFASTADMVWNTWGAKASYLPFMHELTFYGLGRATLNAGAGLTLDVGSPLRLPGDSASAGPWTGPHDLRFNVTQDVKEGRSVLSGPPLKMSGVYGPATGDLRPVLAVNPDAREANIRHVHKEAMAAALGTEVANISENPAALIWLKNADAAGSSFGASLVLIALILFLVESILAIAFSTYR